MKKDLDYDEQCDVAFGRCVRFLAKNPQVENLSEAIDKGLDLSGLGLSGYQAEVAFGQAIIHAPQQGE